MYKAMFVLFFTLFLSACSSLPDNLATANKNVITDFTQWKGTDLNVANEVRLGGVVASVTNLADKTRIEMVNMPISSSGRPDLLSEPTGRYVAYIDGYVESMSLANGRLVTFLGVSDGIEQGKVGDFDTDFPVINVTSYYLWRIEEKVIVNESGSILHPCWGGIHCRSSSPSSNTGRVVRELK